MSGALRTRRPATPALRDIQAPVHDRLEEASKELERIAVADFPMLEDMGRYLLHMRGKMFRPTLALLSSAVDGRPEPRSRTVAATIELVHLATLVHDDSVDHSVMRRGMPTLNALFSHQVSVIMGDFLYSRAMVELVRLGDIEMLRVLAAATNAMTIGEMRQLTSLDALAFSEDDYESLIRAKTASLLSAACELGALAGAARHRQALARYGMCLGMGFQVADDILDYVSTEVQTGKPTGADLKEHKVTLPLIAALRSMSAAGRRDVDALFGTAEPGDDQIARVTSIVSEEGGIEYARRRAAEYATGAEEALDGLPDSPVLVSLHDAIAYAVERSN
ncbi:MAG TPA: polyprenyl synthetase family protein [Gemmatimonadaceae bacterium]|nr:polyprenyl synthetase family protein [Gemmatimonadaceae bacterium]